MHFVTLTDTVFFAEFNMQNSYLARFLEKKPFILKIKQNRYILLHKVRDLK